MRGPPRYTRTATWMPYTTVCRSSGRGGGRMAIERLAVVGLGMIGSSMAGGAKAKLPHLAVTGHDASAAVRDEARALGLCDRIADDAADAVADADQIGRAHV